MNAPTESRLLRLAISKGLLAWEDLDAVANRLPAPDGDVPAERLWVQALIDSGRLDAATLSRLTAEVSEQDPALAPTLVEAPPGRAGAVAFPPELRFLKDWERYRVERFLGSGGMGAVYLATDPQLGRRVALKFLHYNDPLLVVRFLREARAQARVEHPNICQVHEVGEVEGRPYIAMQLIEGRSLAELRGSSLRRRGPACARRRPGHPRRPQDRADPPRPQAREHPGGRRRRGRPPPLGGGLRPGPGPGEEGLTRTGLISGTPAYVSPEQAQGAQLDRRRDVYSLGVVLYELLAGARPSSARAPAAILMRVAPGGSQAAAPARIRLPADLETIALKCLEKDPARRYDSARALAEDLDRYWRASRSWPGPPAWPTARASGCEAQALATVTRRRLVLALAGGDGLGTRWLARERAELAQRFGQRVKELEPTAPGALLPPPRHLGLRGGMRRELARSGRRWSGWGHSPRPRGLRAGAALSGPASGRAAPASTWSAPGPRASARPKPPTPWAGWSAP